MRLKILFDNEQDEQKELLVIQEYRQYFISFLKNIFASTKIYKNLYSQKVVKPFTFSVFLGKDLIPLEEKKIKISLPIEFLFSTGDSEIFSYFYNGVLDFKREERMLNISHNFLKIKKIQLLKNIKINSSAVIFKTLGVVILTDPNASAKDFHNYFIIPNDNLEKFNKILEFRMAEKYQRIIGKKIDTKMIFTPINDKELPIFIRQRKLDIGFSQPIKETIVKHYKGYLRGFKGIFYLEAHPEMLQFIYDYGLGIRTGQGFGMVDLVAQI